MENLVGKTFEYKDQGRFEGYDMKKLSSGRVVIITDRFAINLYPSEYNDFISNVQLSIIKPQKPRAKIYISKQPMSNGMLKWSNRDKSRVSNLEKNDVKPIEETDKETKIQDAKSKLDQYQKIVFNPTHEIHRVKNTNQVARVLNIGKWLEKEDNLIKQDYPYGDLKRLANDLNRSISKTMTRAFFLQVKRMV